MPMDSPTAEVDVFGDGFIKTLEDALPEIITRTCEKCNREIMHEMVTVSPCQHVVCPQCIIKRLVTWRKKFEPCNCPCAGCKTPMESHSYSINGATEAEKVEHVHPIADKTKDPFRFFKNQSSEQRKNMISLSCCYETADGKAASINVYMDLDAGPQTPEEEEQLLDIAALMHGPILKRSQQDEGPNDRVPRLTATEVEGFAIHEDCRLLTKFMYAISSGYSKLNVEELDTVTAKKKYFASFGASELVLHVNSTKPGRLQMMVADLIENHPAAKNVREILSRFCLSASPSHMNNLSSEAAFDEATYGIDFSPYALSGLNFDNLGFRKKAGYDQWTIILLQTTTEEQLKRIGFYETDPSKRINRTAKVWGDVIKDFTDEHGHDQGQKLLAAKVVGVRPIDCKRVALYVLTHMSTVMKLSLPNEDDCWDMDTTGDYEWHCAIPKNLGIALKSPSSDTTSLGTEPPQCQQVSVPQQANTLFESAKLTPDNPYHADPAARSTISEIAKYSLRSTVKARGSGNHPSGEEPVQKIMVPITADGSPTSIYYGISDEDKWTGRHRFDDIRFFPGGFHCNLETHRMRGKLFYDHWGYYVRKFRPTAGQSNWIMLPGDPRDVESELLEYVCAHYRCAADELAKQKGREVSPTEVDDHMWHRASQHPLCMGVLLELRFAEVTIMMRDSEKDGDVGDVELFLTCIRLCLVLYTVTHATKYVPICCHFLQWWECSSDAEKILFKNCLFTRKSPNGKPLWADRSMEWVMKALRQFLGKHARQGHEGKMHKVVSSVEWRLKNKLAARHLADHSDSSSLPWNEQSTPISKVYIKTYLCLLDDKIYSAANPACSVSHKDPNVFCLPDGRKIRTSLLCANSIGKERALKYFIHWYIHTQNEATHSEREVPLTLLRCLAEQSAKDWKLRLDAQLTTDPRKLKIDKEMKRLMTKPEIQKELDWLRSDFYPNLPEYPEKTKRDDLVDALCTYRTTYFRDFPEAKDGYKELYEDLAEEETLSSEHDRERELLDSFFKLDTDVKARFSSVVQRGNVA